MRYLLRAPGIAGVCLAAAVGLGQAAEKELTGDQIPTGQGNLILHPVEHATFVMQWNGKTVYVDPVGGAKAFAGLPRPDLVLVTHGHFDHFDPATLEGLVPAASRARIVAPKEVAEKIPQGPLKEKTTILANGEKAEVDGIGIEAVPAYNITPERRQFHPKGQGNGYLVRMGGKTVYVAGDTENIPEMRGLKGVDVALLPMNEPYTMSVSQAADAVRAVQAEDRLPLSLPQQGRLEGRLGVVQEARRRPERHRGPNPTVVSAVA